MDFFLTYNPNFFNLFYFYVHLLPILPQTNVSVLADEWLRFRGVKAVSTSLTAYSCYCLSLHSRKTGSKEEEEMGPWKDRHQQRREKPRRGEERGRTTGKRGKSLNRFCRSKRGMNIPILPCSLETTASSFGGQHCLCLFPAWLFAWCIPQLYIQWWEKDDVLEGWQWGLRGAEVGTVSLIQCKDQRPCFFSPN